MIQLPPDNEADYIEASEGRLYAPYDDATGDVVEAGAVCKGTLTVGVGHTGPDVVAGELWTIDRVQAVYDADRALARSEAAGLLAAAWGGMGMPRQVAFTDMAFELGEGGLAGFPHMLSAANAGDWATASRQAIASRYDAEVPKRARRNAYALAVGSWPGIDLWS